MGQACWLAEDAWPGNLAPITLGDRVCLSQGAYLCTGNHNFRSPGFDLRLAPICIGSYAWIAARAVLAPGTVVRAIRRWWWGSDRGPTTTASTRAPVCRWC